MNTIPQTNENRNDFVNSTTNFVKKFKVISALKKANCYKEKGICVHDILLFITASLYW